MTTGRAGCINFVFAYIYHHRFFLLIKSTELSVDVLQIGIIFYTILKTSSHKYAFYEQKCTF